MNTNLKSSKKLRLILWMGAILSLFILVGIFGWKLFYGFVVPRSVQVITLPLTGVIGFSMVAGALSFFAPCPFAVFPAYAAFFLSKSQEKESLKMQALKFAVTASAGVVIFYVLLGLVLATLGTQLAFYTNYLKLGVSVFIFLFGVILVGGKQLPTGFIDIWVNDLSAKLRNWGVLRQGSHQVGEAGQAFGYGVVYAIAGAACFLPVILSISLIPILSGKFLIGFIAFVSYGLAISVMLVAATFILASGKQKLLQSLAGKSGTIKKLSGVILIATAIFLVAFYIKTCM